MIRFPFVAYPAIEEHGMIGDRRTAALGMIFKIGKDQLAVWVSNNVDMRGSAASQVMNLHQAEELWAVPVWTHPGGLVL
ncbi:hypothetical protein [Nitrospira sp. Nam74]